MCKSLNIWLRREWADMNPQGQIPRSRGAICGVLLILLGLWGGLAPFVGPYFHFGYTPDKTFYYSSGRLYFSVIPGAAALLGGLLVLATRNRGVGAFGGVLAALGGAWFVAGAGLRYLRAQEVNRRRRPDHDGQHGFSGAASDISGADRSLHWPWPGDPLRRRARRRPVLDAVSQGCGVGRRPRLLRRLGHSWAVLDLGEQLPHVCRAVPGWRKFHANCPVSRHDRSVSRRADPVPGDHDGPVPAARFRQLALHQPARASITCRPRRARRPGTQQA